MRKKLKRSYCPLSCTLDLFGDRWSLILIRDLMNGKSHFKEFMASPEKIATNILSNRLNNLLKLKMIETCPSPIYSGRFGYHLTQKGKSLKPLISQMSEWGLSHIQGTK